jgi:hydroxymethylbilane synthase
MKNTLIIGTRGSKLALYQAERVEAEIKQFFPEIKTEIKVIQTKGDIILDVALAKIGDKGLFTKEIENALLDNSIDIAVHSLKDLSTDLPEGLQLGAVLERGEYRDALVHKTGKKLSELDENDVIATSSLRRIASLKHTNKNLQITDIRGNVLTRLKKMEDGHCDGMIMAAAGLHRLGLDKYITEVIEPEQIIPAVAQGAIAIENRINDCEIDKIIAKLNHAPTLQAVMAERVFLNTLQGGCQVPVGCYSSIKNKTITLTGFVSSLDATEFLKETINGSLSEANRLAKTLAERIIKRGGKAILDNIKNTSV